MRNARTARTVVALALVPGLLLAASVSATAAPPKPALTSLTVNTGSTAGGVRTTLSGIGLAAAPCTSPSPCSAVTFSVGTGPAVAATSVRALSTGQLQVVVPASAAVGKATVTVTPVGGSELKKVGAFTYTAAPPVVTASNGTPVSGGVLAGSPSSDTPTAGQTLTGSNLSGATLMIGSTSVKPTATTATSITYTAPKVAPGYQPVVVKAAGGTVDAGVVLYSGVTPAATAIRDSTDTTPVTTVSPGRSTTLVVRGTHLGTVRSAVLRDAAGVVADQPFTVGAAAADGSTLRLTVPRGLKGVAAGNLVLKTAYTESTTSGATALATLSGSKPTLANGLSLVSGATSLAVTGANLDNLLSLQLNGRPVSLSNVSAATAGGFTLTVPALTATTADGTAALSVITDFGRADGTVTVLAPPRLTSITVDVGANTATLTSSKPLHVPSGTLSDDQAAQFTFTATRDGDLVPITPTGITALTSTLTASFEDGDLEAGDLVGVTYTPGDDEDRLVATDAAGGAPLAASSAPLTTTAPVSFSSVQPNLVTGVVTITGQGLAATNEVTLTSSTSTTTRTGAALTATTTDSPRATTLSFAGPTVPGEYTVTVKSAPGGAAIIGPTPPRTVTVLTPTIGAVSRDPDTGTITVTGTNLKTTNEFTLASPGRTSTTRTGGALTVASDGSSTQFAGPVELGTWTVTMKVAARGAPVMPPSANTVDVVAPVLSSSAADASAQTITLTADTALAPVAAPATARTGQFELSRSHCGGGAVDVSSAITGLSASGTSVVLTLSPGTLSAGDAITADYTHGDPGVRLRGASGTEVAGATGLSTSLPLPARTFTGVTRNAGTGEITLEGTNLATTNVVTVTSTSGYSATPSVTGGGTSLALDFDGNAPTASDAYTVQLKESSTCGTVIDSQTFDVT